MKKLSIAICFLVFMGFAATANAQTPIQFSKGASSKTLTITVKPGNSNKYSIAVRKGQVINVSMDGDISVSKTEEFPVVYASLTNGVEDVDQSQDGEGYLSILAGKTKAYVIEVGNSDKKRARTFKLKVTVTNNKEDFLGGEPVDQ